jgi:hypothetical protein
LDNNLICDRSLAYVGDISSNLKIIIKKNLRHNLDLPGIVIHRLFNLGQTRLLDLFFVFAFALI